MTVLADGGGPRPDTAAWAGAGIPGGRTRLGRVSQPARGRAGRPSPAAPTEEVGGLFVTPPSRSPPPFAEQLGLRMLPSGCVEVDVVGRTSLPGVYAAGDLAHTAAVPMPMASVLSAAGAGLLAATAVDMDRLTSEWGIPSPV